MHRILHNINILSCVFFLKISFGQLPDINPSYHIKQDDYAMVFRTLDFSESQLKKYNDTKTYFWYKAQHVFTTQGGSSGTLLNGKFEAFYLNNQLAYSGNFVKGLKDGEWRYWTNTGVLEHVENWKKGKQIGKQLYYNAQGLVFKTIHFSSNSKTIYSADTIHTFKKTSVTTTIRDSLGNNLQVIRTKNGELHGKQMNLDSLGRPTYTNYANGELKQSKKKTSETKAKDDSTKEKVKLTDRIKALWTKVFKHKKKEKSDVTNTPKTENPENSKTKKTKTKRTKSKTK